MRDSQLDVDRRVNFLFVVADGRSSDHGRMNGQVLNHYQLRFMQAVRHAVGSPNRTAFATRLGVEENAKQIASNWFNRDQRIPSEYRKALNDLGLSIDWINDGEGEMVTRPVQSQAARDQRVTMRAAARIIERAREMIIGDFDEDALIDNAIDAAIEIGPERILSGDGLLEALRVVAARMRTA